MGNSPQQPGLGTQGKCYRCKQRIEVGQLSTWEGGMECHAGRCPAVTPGQRIQNLPQRGKPKTPAELGLRLKQQENPVGYATMASVKKAVGLTNEGQPDSVCPNCRQPIQEGQMVNYPQGRETHVQCPPPAGQQPGQQAPGWRSRLSLPPGYKPKQPQGIVGRVRDAKGKAAGRPAMFSFVVPLNAAGHVAFRLAKAGMEDFEAVNYAEDDATMFVFKNEPEMHVAEEIVKAEFAYHIKRRKGAWALWSPEKDVSAVPEYEKEERQHLMSSEKEAAFDGDLLNSVAKRELVAELVEIRQNEDMGRLDALIRSLKAPEHPEEGFYRGKQFRLGPRLVQSGQKVAGQWGERSYDSDQVHDILDRYRPRGEDSRLGFDEPVPQGHVQDALGDVGEAEADTFIGVVVFFVTHGSAVPPLYRDRARMLAEALAGDDAYLQEWANPQERQAELEKEIDILSRPAAKTALKLPDPDGKFASEDSIPLDTVFKHPMARSLSRPARLDE